VRGLRKNFLKNQVPVAEPMFRSDVRAGKSGFGELKRHLAPSDRRSMLSLHRLTLFANLEAGRARIPS
jgi:hypothetical protein